MPMNASSLITAVPQPSSGWWIASVGAVVFVIALPFVLIILAHARLKVGWRYAAYGALIFFAFQLITRVPAVQALQYVLTPQLKASRTLLIAFLIFLALTAGLFEEVGRYLGYRWFMGREEKTWAKGVMYGLGHGGLESAVLVGGLGAIQLLNVWLITSTNLGIVPAAQRATAVAQLTTIAAQPGWLPLLAGWERICAITAHVMFSLIVLQVFRRGSLWWLWLAVGLHALLDGVTVLLPQFVHLGGIGDTLLIEGFITLFAIGALWAILALRDRPSSPPQPVAEAGALRDGAA